MLVLIRFSAVLFYSVLGNGITAYGFAISAAPIEYVLQLFLRGRITSRCLSLHDNSNTLGINYHFIFVTHTNIFATDLACNISIALKNTAHSATTSLEIRDDI